MDPDIRGWGHGLLMDEVQVSKVFSLGGVVQVPFRLTTLKQKSLSLSLVFFLFARSREGGGCPCFSVSTPLLILCTTFRMILGRVCSVSFQDVMYNTIESALTFIRYKTDSTPRYFWERINIPYVASTLQIILLNDWLLSATCIYLYIERHPWWIETDTECSLGELHIARVAKSNLFQTFTEKRSFVSNIKRSLKTKMCKMQVHY